MASTSTTFIGNINVTFPVAGQDNDTQGFRDNYSNIKNGLLALAGEVTTLQSDSAYITQTNNFQQNIIQNASLQSVSSVIGTHVLGAIGGNQTVDYTEGNFQRWNITSATNFSFTNWPVDANSNYTYGSVVLELSGAVASVATPTSVTFLATKVSLDTSNTQLQNPVSLTTSSVVRYEVSSWNGNNEIFVRFLGGPYK